MEWLANCTRTRSHNSVLLSDCTTHATISSSSLLDSGSCTTNSQTSINVEVQAKIKAITQLAIFHEIVCLAYYHQGASTELAKTHAGDYVKLVKGLCLASEVFQCKIDTQLLERRFHLLVCHIHLFTAVNYCMLFCFALETSCLLTGRYLVAYANVHSQSHC